MVIPCPHKFTFLFIFLTSNFDLGQKSFLFLKSFLLCEVLPQQEPKGDSEENLEPDKRQSTR